MRCTVKYTTIDIPVGVTVRFINHPKGAPVVWLSSGEVRIAGTVNLDGTDGTFGVVPAGSGPGGFAGGLGALSSSPASGGFGPGGAGPNGMGGSFSSPGGIPYTTYPPIQPCAVTGQGPIYGNPEIIPLIGGSGGSGGGEQRCGGGGGGAMLIASSSRIVHSGLISARGGSGLGTGYTSGGGGGAGGGVRLVAPEVTGTGQLIATGGAGGLVWTCSGCCHGGAGSDGRIRLEADVLTLTPGTSPLFTWALPGALFPTGVTPRLRVTGINGQQVDQDPFAGVQTIDEIVESVLGADADLIDIDVENAPPGTRVLVRVTPERGEIIESLSTPLKGDVAHSMATAAVPLPAVRAEIQLIATWEP